MRSNPFNKQNLYTFTNRRMSDLRKGNARFSTAKANLSVVTKMVINLRVKHAMKYFFRHEIS